MPSFGTLVGSAIPNQAAAIQAVALGGFLLVFLLSGLIFPVENIPAGLRWISNIVWGRYYIVIVRDALLQGGGWPAMWFSVLMIAVIGAIFFTLAWLRMRAMQVRHETTVPAENGRERLRVLIRKEFNQIRRDRRLAMSLIVPPTLQILLFGFALDSTVSNLRLGVIDYSHTPESREMIVVTSPRARASASSGYINSNRELEQAISEAASMPVWSCLTRSPATSGAGGQWMFRCILNASNANTATIGQGYAAGLIQAYNNRARRPRHPPGFDRSAGASSANSAARSPL